MNGITWFILLIIIIITTWIIIRAYQNAKKGKCIGCSHCDNCAQSGTCPAEHLLKKLEQGVDTEEHHED